MVASALEFWFEFGSTYSYLSAVRIEDTEGVQISWRPFLLGPIFKEQGWDDSPFNVYPAKGRYMWRDMERMCAKFEPWLPDFVRAAFRANFAEDREIGEAAEIRSILEELGQPGAKFVEQALTPENKQRLREHTQRAIERGIFGAPSFVVDGELFWGNDRLEDALTWHKAHAES